MFLPIAVAAVAALSVVACGDDGGNDDGGTVRPINTDGGSGSGPGSGSGSGSGSEPASGPEPASGSKTVTTGEGSESGSGSGIEVDPGATTDDPLVLEGAEQYTGYVRGQTEQIVTDVKAFTDAVRSGDLEAAMAGYAPSRQASERIEPIAGLVEDIDVAVDARVDDFESEDDPAWTGWHKLEYLIFEVGDIAPESGAGELADRLDADLATLQETMSTTDIEPAAIPVGAAELIEEVSAGKITGEEDRYSGTDLWDFAANVEGSKAAFEFMEPAVEAADPDLVTAIQEGFDEVAIQLEEYEDGDGGYLPFDELTPDDSDTMKTTLAELSENLALVAGVLGLE
ncbi:MAG: EfeM/EfeO family lipoprotein [Actinomycetota bacterium]|nr:EfeM/EfeO family lipoprotein [Actinomycetota bacterium]